MKSKTETYRGEQGLEKQHSVLSDLSVLVKLRLNLFVVMSAVMAACIAQGGMIEMALFVKIALGGFLITAAGAILNQVLELELDGKMNRTKDRPLVQGRISVSSAVFLAGIASIAGTFVLALINPMVSFLGMISFISYAFIYTPLKKIHPIAVQLGAIPGALPMAIGVIAVQGTITPLAILLFCLQFFWQMPHFWAIAWLSQDDYERAGLNLLPGGLKKKHRSVGLYAAMYSAALLIVAALLYFQAEIPLLGSVGMGIISLWYFLRGMNLYKKGDDKSARKLLYASFAYLPITLLIIILSMYL